MRKFLFMAFVICSFSFRTTEAQTLQVGTPAPPLQFTQLLQAPPGARADWKALRGKVVVLEFWATWCAPCVKDIPRLNEIEASLDPAKVQFISVDDQDPKVVQTFLAKQKMAGWAGVDTTASIFKRYDITARPTTVIVDTHGRVAGVTDPEALEADDLLAVAAGEKVAFQHFGAPSLPSSRTMLSSVDSLFSFAFTKASPATPFDLASRRGYVRWAGARADLLLSFAFGVPEDRFIMDSSLREATYNLEIVLPEDESLPHSIFQNILTTGLHIRMEPKTVTTKVYVLHATDRSHALLLPVAPNGDGGYSYWEGKVHVFGAPMDKFAAALEDALHHPVFNETGITGAYNAELAIPSGDATTAKELLAKTLGLELDEEDRPVQMLEAAPLSDAPSPSPQEAPKPQK